MRLAILSEGCGACPFKGEFAGLRSGRLASIMDETLPSRSNPDGSYFACHATVDYGHEEDGSDCLHGGAAICAGWLEAARTKRRVPTIIQVAERLGLVEYREPPTKGDGDAE